MLPWFASAKHKGNLGIADCVSCKASTPRLNRQALVLSDSYISPPATITSPHF